MTTAKSAVFVGYNFKIVVYWGGGDKDLLEG